MTLSSRTQVVAQLRAAGCVFAEDEAELLLTSGLSGPALIDLIDRRVAGEPLEYLLGWAEFAGQRIVVEPGVFVPRRRTELMVAVAVPLLQAEGILLDLCCGSGAVAAAVVAAVANVQVFAADCDPVAVQCARRNLPGAQVFQGDLFAPLPPEMRGRLDVIAANAPYVPSDSIALMPPEARLYEAPVALNGGPDGLDVLRRVINQARSWLVPGGSLLVEAGEDQLRTVRACAKDAGWTFAMHTDDDAIVVELRA